MAIWNCVWKTSLLNAFWWKIQRSFTLVDIENVYYKSSWKVSDRTELWWFMGHNEISGFGGPWYIALNQCQHSWFDSYLCSNDGNNEMQILILVKCQIWITLSWICRILTLWRSVRLYHHHDTTLNLRLSQSCHVIRHAVTFLHWLIWKSLS